MIKRLIPTSFTIPTGYRREFQFHDAQTEFACRIVVDEGGLHFYDGGGVLPLTASRCLDWIAESIGEVRKELGA